MEKVGRSARREGIKGARDGDREFGELVINWIWGAP